MTKVVQRVIAAILSTVGTLLALYIGGYWMFVRPLYSIYYHFTNGGLTLHILFIAALKIFLSATVVGNIWIIFDIAAGFFRGYEDYEDHD